MTDEAMRDLLARHDTDIVEQKATIKSLVVSVEHLVVAQTETNEQLKDISKYLAKQAIFTNKLETMDREIKEAFVRRDKDLAEKIKRFHQRVDEIDVIQKDENGCNSVRLLHKDVESISRDVIRLVGLVEEHRLSIEQLEKKDAAAVAPATIRWATGIIVLYSITFGTYVVQGFNEMNSLNSKISVLLERNIRDVRELIYKKDK